MKLHVVVDMQNDFIDGALGTPEAQAIVPAVAAKVKKYVPDNDRTLLATLVGDTKIRVSRKCAPEFKTRMSGN